jgi:hypothetical protein
MTEPTVTLVAKLETATEPSMALSREVARAVGWVNRGNSRKGEWFHPSDVRDGKPVLDSLRGTDVHRDPPHFTGSFDAALLLARDMYEAMVMLHAACRAVPVPTGAYDSWSLIRAMLEHALKARLL